MYSYFRMPSTKKRLTEPTKDRIIDNNFLCRVCKGKHALRDCRNFLSKPVDGRMRLVLLHGYCPNCLAHKHSAGSCFTKKGCKTCGSNHHTLLHINGEQRSPKASKIKGRSANKKNDTSKSVIPKSVSITSITTPNGVALFPTTVVTVQAEANQTHVRAVLDTCSSVSKISMSLVEELKLPTIKFGNDTICSVVIRSRKSPYVTIEATMEVNNRMSLKIPAREVNSAIRTRLNNIVLADPNFFKPSSVAIVFGADLYSKIVLPGLIPSHDGLPVAMNTIFGWVLSGSCNTSDAS